MKYTFLSVALATAFYTSAQTTTLPSNRSTEVNRAAAEQQDRANRLVNRASEWSQQSALEARKIDSSKLVKKTVSQELSLPKALDVLIDMSGELIINTWNENKIKIETAIQYEEPAEFTNEQWLEKAGINMKIFGSTVKVKSRPATGITYFGNGVTTLVNTSYAINYSNANSLFNIQKGPVTLYIPAESILEIESKSGRLKIKNNIKSLLLDNTDGQIEFANIEKLQVRSNRGSFSGGIVTDGDIELTHGRFSLKQLNKGIIKSDYSTIEIESLKELKLTSSNDEIDIDNVATLTGSKNYGNLRINQLTSKLDVQGMNSDIKLRHIDPSTQLVKIINRNADLRLPTDKLSNFSVDLKGNYNTVYSFFAETMVVDTMTTAEIESVKALTTAAAQNPKSINITGGSFNQYNSGGGVTITTSPLSSSNFSLSQNNRIPWLKYSAKTGTGSNGLKYELICTSCVIDFK